MTNTEQEISPTEQWWTALTESIAHWDRLIAGAPGEQPNAKQCACCAIWIDCARDYDDEYGCRGCPVSTRANLPICGGTPFDEAEKAWGRARWAPNNPEAFKAAAIKMRDYLAETLRMIKAGELTP